MPIMQDFHSTGWVLELTLFLSKAETYPVADLGGAVGDNCPPPFMMKNQLGAPFSARRVPLLS